MVRTATAKKHDVNKMGEASASAAQSSEVEITISSDPRADILMTKKPKAKDKKKDSKGGYEQNYQQSSAPEEPRKSLYPELP